MCVRSRAAFFSSISCGPNVRIIFVRFAGLQDSGDRAELRLNQ
jgi:hypothetical protein